MTFASTLNDFCSSLPFTGKEIAAACHISASALSRYRKGERIPHTNSDTISNLALGIESLYAQVDAENPPSATEIEDMLLTSIGEERHRGLAICEKIDKLMTALSLRNSEIARDLSIDPSFISRIRSKQRIPAKPNEFSKRFARSAAKRCLDRELFEELHEVTGIDTRPFAEDAQQTKTARTKLARAIAAWILENPA